jgi:quercetin dioxygenase-like cupin family protein
MNALDFESALKRAGYLDVETKQAQPDLATPPHSHPFDVRALVLEGELTLVTGDRSRTYCAGEVFEMSAGCEHSERHGPAGTRYLVGRRHPAPER